jgi:hypothetical protein
MLTSLNAVCALRKNSSPAQCSLIHSLHRLPTVQAFAVPKLPAAGGQELVLRT